METNKLITFTGEAESVKKGTLLANILQRKSVRRKEGTIGAHTHTLCGVWWWEKSHNRAHKHIESSSRAHNGPHIQPI